MTAHAKLPPAYLVDRYRGWRRSRFEQDRAWYARLAEVGQRPRAMVISCCDSRVDPVALFGGEPGDLFVVRNVAAIVPPYAPDHAHHGTSAAVEFAVTGLKVAHILVVGHSSCGGVAACHDLCSGEGAAVEGTFIGRWMDILRPGYDEIAGVSGSRAERLRALEHEGVKVSLRNLESFPFVAEALAAGSLSLHGGWIDIGVGALHLYDPETRNFRAVDPAG